MPFQIPAVGLKLRNMGTRSASQTLCIALHALRARATITGFSNAIEIHCILINMETVARLSHIFVPRFVINENVWRENVAQKMHGIATRSIFQFFWRGLGVFVWNKSCIGGSSNEATYSTVTMAIV